MIKFSILCIAGLFLFKSYGQEYKQLMNDNSVNFYKVCESAETYFETIDKHAKGSGWKGYQRWKNANEYKYFPSGDRTKEDPFFVVKAYQNFIANNPQSKSSFNNGWNELGPRFIDSITGHYSAGLGRIEDFYVDPNNDNRIYLGSRSGGFWKTNDGGNNWEVTTDFLFSTGVNTITASPTNPDSVLINIRNANNGYSNGIYRSTDGGDTWTLSNFNPTNVGFGGLGDNFKIYKIAYHPTIANLIFIGTSKGIYRSTDNLQTWSSQITSGDIMEIEFHPTDPNYVYLYDDYYWGTNQNVVLISSNIGVSYTSSNTIQGNIEATGRLSVSKDCNDCVFFASDNGVWRSIDKAQTFTFLSNPPQGCGAYAVNDLDTNLSVYGYLDLVASNDGGINYTQKTYWSFGSTPFDGGEYIHADLRKAKSINGVFYVSTDGLLCKSSDAGNTWEILSQGTGIRENYKLGTSQSNHYRTISGSQDNGTSIKVKDLWIEFYGADGMEGLIHPLNDNWMMGSVQYGSRRRTTNGGQSQTGATPPDADDAAWEAPLTYDPNNQMHLLDFRDSIWKSEDFGNTWNYLGKPNGFTGSINQSAIAENNSEIIVISKSSYIEKSTDGGLTFSSIKNNLPSYYIEDIAFNPLDDDNIFVTYARYQNDVEKVFMTNDGGTSWTNITFNLGNMPIHSIVVDNDENLYIGGEIGVYTMPRGSNSWQLYNTNLPNTTIQELEICHGSNTLKAATWGRGLYEYTLVGKNDYPSILTTRITDMPTTSAPKEGVPQFVTSTIAYDNSITETYLLWSINSLGFGDRIDMTNTVDSTWTSDLALPNGNIGDKVYFKIITIGDNNDTTETYKFMYELRPYEYCESEGDMIYNGSVTLVSLEDINNATGKNSPYTDYTSSATTNLIAGDTYQLTVNLNTDNGNYTYYATAWIDWNSDSDFDDQDERYDLGSTTNNSNGPTDLSPLNVTVPALATPGITRMRVSCHYNNYPEVCDIGFDGEVEDYGINIISSLGLNEFNSEFLSKIYPNPAKNELNLEFKNGFDSGTITILDASGKLTITDNWTNSNLKKINIESIAKGIYFVQLDSNGKRTTTKIVIE